MHERKHFRFRALPVLGGEGVERQILDAQIAAAFDALAHRFRALLVAFDPRQPAVLGPAAVAVHDDSYMARDGWGTLGHLAYRRMVWPRAGPTLTTVSLAPVSSASRRR